MLRAFLRSPWGVLCLVWGCSIVVGLVLLVPPGARSDAERTQRSALTAQLRNLESQGRSREALNLARKKLPNVRMDGRLAYALTLINFNVEDFEATQQWALKTLEFEPDNEWAVRFYLYAGSDLGRHEQCIEFGEKWAQSHPDAIMVHKDLAILLSESGRKEEAFQKVALAHGKLPADTRVAGIYFFIGIEVLGAETMMPRIEEWLKTHARDDWVYEQIGRALSETGEYELALEYLQRAQNLGNTSWDVTAEMLDSYRGIGDLQRFEVYAKTYLISHTPNADWWNLYGAIYYDAGGYKRAAEGFQKALELNPDLTTAAANLIFVYFEEQRPRDGIRFAHRWLENGRQPNPLMLRALAYCHWDASEYDKAEEWLRQLMAREDTARNARDMVDLLVVQGRYEDAASFGSQWLEQHDGHDTSALEDAVRKAEYKAYVRSRR